MPVFDSKKMSLDELVFIRAYCKAIRRNYDCIDTALTLLAAFDGLLCPFRLTPMARELIGMREQFDAAIAVIGRRILPENKKKRLNFTGKSPAPSDIGAVFSLSFFKLINAATKAPISTITGEQSHDGWSSGRPQDWNNTLKLIADMQLPQHNQKDIFPGKMFNLFAAIQNATEDYEDIAHDDSDAYTDNLDDDNIDGDYLDFFN